MSPTEDSPGGQIETLRFARLLARFWEQGFTGYFRARSTVRPGVTISKEILIEHGRVAWAASDDPEESIRVHLINRGMLRPDQWRLAEEKSGASQVRQTLLDLGFLTARELQEADRERVTALVLGLFTWREGRYETVPGPLPHGTPSLKIDPRDLVLEGLMSSGDRGRVLDEIGTLDAVLIVRPDDLVRASLSIPVELAGLMGKADGTRTVADICALSPLSDFLISAAFGALKVLGLARPVEGGVTAAPPAPPIPAPERPPLRRRTQPRESAAREGLPRLPLSASADSGDPDDLGEPGEYETIPMAATPPGGVRKSAGSPLPVSGRAPTAATLLPPAVPVPPGVQASEGEAVHASVPAPGVSPKADHEPVIQIEPPPIAEESALAPFRDEAHESPVETSGETPSVGAERESEVALKPGIPVSPLLDDEEIEDAIQIFDAPREAEKEALQEPVEVLEDEEAPGEEPSPAWVYEPSRMPSGTAHPRRWATWGGLAAAFAGLAFALVVLFGGARGNPEEAAPRGAPVTLPPADVVAPAAFAPESDSTPRAPGPAIRAASLDIPTSPKALPEAERVNPASPERAPRAPRAAPAARVAEPPASSIFSTGAFKEGRWLIDSGAYGDAAGRFAAGLGQRKGMYTVQLALACETTTIARAAGSTHGANQFFIVPTSYRGQACYRMLWGIFPSKSSAEGARAGIPQSFLKDPHPPVVTGL
ncbi:MAG TPA: DUF4388 domain-containing protein [Verrucomicrobiae bacterium]|nr:DUF4388 domain-containing protein [Verrucomicrobiae bacterium]